MLQNNEKWIQISVAETILYHLGKHKLVSVAYTAHQDKCHMDHLIKHNKNGNCTSYRRKHVDFCIIYPWGQWGKHSYNSKSRINKRLDKFPYTQFFKISWPKYCKTENEEFTGQNSHNSTIEKVNLPNI